MTDVGGSWRGGGGWGGLLVVGAEGYVVHVEEKDVTSIGCGCDGEVLGQCGIASRRVIVVWSRQSEVVLSIVSRLLVCKAGKASYIAAFAIIVGGSSCMGYGTCVSVFVIDGG